MYYYTTHIHFFQFIALKSQLHFLNVFQPQYVEAPDTWSHQVEIMRFDCTIYSCLLMSKKFLRAVKEYKFNLFLR